MSMVTKRLYALDCMNEDKHNKIDLAVEQLEFALKIFLKGESYASSLTLAGAAEEMLGKALNIKGIENSLQEQFKTYHKSGFEWLNPPKTWCEFTTHGKNKVRNSVKHLSNSDDLDFEADIKDESMWMLVRAIDNFQRLGFQPTEITHEFNDWFYQHYVGI